MTKPPGPKLHRTPRPFGFIPPQIPEAPSTFSTPNNVSTADTPDTSNTTDTPVAPTLRGLDLSNTIASLSPSLRIVTNGLQLFLRTAYRDGTVGVSEPKGCLEDLVALEFHGSPRALGSIRTLVSASRC